VHPLSESRTVTVFGGTGFLGRRVVGHLLGRDFTARIAARHAKSGGTIIKDPNGRLEVTPADIHNEKSIASAVADAFAVVNAVSLYVEQGPNTFRSVHVEAASRLARCSRAMDVARFVHVSGIGANAASSSSYIRSRGEGEQAVRVAFPQAAIVRSSVMFGPDDAFLTPLANLAFRGTAFSEPHMCPCTVLGASSYDLPEQVATEVKRFFKMCQDKLVAQGLSPTKAKEFLSTIVGDLVVASALRDTAEYDRATRGLQRERKAAAA
jgi:hypothetical protein